MLYYCICTSSGSFDALHEYRQQNNVVTSLGEQRTGSYSQQPSERMVSLGQGKPGHRSGVRVVVPSAGKLFLCLSVCVLVCAAFWPCSPIVLYQHKGTHVVVHHPAPGSLLESQRPANRCVYTSFDRLSSRCRVQALDLYLLLD